MHHLNCRMDGAGGQSPLLHCDYPLLLTAQRLGGNSINGTNAGLLIYYSQKQSLYQYAYTLVGR